MEQGDQKGPRSPESIRDRDDGDLQVSKSAVPRFASFKPRKATPDREDGNTNTLRTPGSRAPEKGDGGHVEARPERHRRHRHGKRGRKERTEEDRALASHHTHESPSRFGSGHIDRENTVHFIEDRKSDENNVRYGTSSRYTVPKYHEVGRYGLLGLSRRFKTTPELKPGQRLITTEHFGSADRHGARSLRTSSLKESGMARVIAQERNDAEVDARRSYLPLSPHRSRKRRKLHELHPSGNGLSESLLPDNNAYDSDRSAEGQDLESLPTSSDSEPEPASESTSISSSLKTARERHVYLSRLVDQDPSNVDAWLALIQHQDVMLAEGSDASYRASSNAQKRGLADVKLSMYAKAFSKTKGHPLQDRLVHGMMREGAKVWDTSKLAKEWRSTLKEHPNSLGLWVQYLTFRMTSFVTFSYESCREVFKDILDLFSTRQASTDGESIRIYVVLRMTTFMREAGFSEHAHALWQAILEYCFFEPSSDQANNELFSFEDFWDSEVPRLGEEGARGWRMSQRVEWEPRSDPSLPTITNRNPFNVWIAKEQWSTSSSMLPARTLDEVDEDDPYRVILFSDIQPFLFRPSSQQARKQLLEAFLCFCGLPPPHLEVGINQLLSEDPFLNDPFLDPSHTTLDEWLISAERNDPYGFPMPCCAIDTLSLWANSESCFTPRTGLQSVRSNRARSEWVQRSLRQLLAAFPNNELFSEYTLAFQSQFDVKEARKFAKSLLKQQPSLRLYNAFALLEWNTGNSEAAERVWSTALSMCSSFSTTSQQDTILIWRSWLWALLGKQDFPKALRLCLAVPDEKFTPDDLNQSGTAYLEEYRTTKLRAHQYLASLLNQRLSLNKPDLSIHYLDVLVLLTYLNSGRNLAAALTHYKTTLTHPTIARSPYTLCLLHQSRALLLHLHAQTSPTGFRPSDITSPLAESIRLFPSNTIFLSLYHFHTRRSLLTDRIRHVIPTLTNSSSSSNPKSDHTASSLFSPLGSITPPLFQIWTELNRPTFAGSTSHSIRSAFEKAVSSTLDSDSGCGPDSTSLSSSSSSPPGSHSPIIWHLYILWEVHFASNQLDVLQRAQLFSTAKPTKPNAEEKKKNPLERAITVFHRAIRACPWCKGLYMLAFQLPQLREALQEAELRAVYGMLGEKGLRVHVELETVEEMMRGVLETGSLIR